MRKGTGRSGDFNRRGGTQCTGAHADTGCPRNGIQCVRSTRRCADRVGVDTGLAAQGEGFCTIRAVCNRCRSGGHSRGRPQFNTRFTGIDRYAIDDSLEGTGHDPSAGGARAFQCPCDSRGIIFYALATQRPR